MSQCITQTSRGVRCAREAGGSPRDRLRCPQHAQMRFDALLAQERENMRAQRALHATNLATVLHGVTGERSWAVLDDNGIPAVSMSIEAAEKLFAAIQFAKAFGTDEWLPGERVPDGT